MLLLPLLVCALCLKDVGAYEYCKKEAKICRSRVKRHIICFKEQIPPESEYQKHIFMTDHLRGLFLYWHNHFRNEVACGRTQGSGEMLSTASQMRELMWDHELEYLAHVHAGRCRMQHDMCRNGERYPFTGQNLAYGKQTDIPPDPIHRLYKAHIMWYDESKDVDNTIVKSYGHVGDKKIGHFTVLANDKIGKVGCAMTACKSFAGVSPVLYYNYITCDYDFTNIPGMPVYIEGPTASECHQHGVGKSSNFTCLCDKSTKSFKFS